MSFCDKIASIAKLLALVDNLKRSLLFGILRTGTVVKVFFSISKAFYCSILQVQILSFLVKLESGFNILVKFSMNLQ